MIVRTEHVVECPTCDRSRVFSSLEAAKTYSEVHQQTYHSRCGAVGGVGEVSAGRPTGGDGRRPPEPSKAISLGAATRPFLRCCDTPRWGPSCEFGCCGACASCGFGYTQLPHGHEAA